jgi:hypothetical protein
VAPVHISELVFEVTEDAGADTRPSASQKIYLLREIPGGQLRANVKETTEAYFFDAPKPKFIRLHLIRNEVLTME